MFIRTLRGRGASPRVLDSLRGCQYHMTSYDEDTSSSKFIPAYGNRLDSSAVVRNIGSITCGAEDIVGCAAAPT